MSNEKEWKEQNRDHELIIAFLFGLPPFAKLEYVFDGFFEDLQLAFKRRGWLTERQTEAVRKQMKRQLKKDTKDSSPFYDE
jgi:ribosomal protein L16/L10AE